MSSETENVIISDSPWGRAGSSESKEAPDKKRKDLIKLSVWGKFLKHFFLDPYISFGRFLSQFDCLMTRTDKCRHEGSCSQNILHSFFTNMKQAYIWKTGITTLFALLRYRQNIWKHLEYFKSKETLNLCLSVSLLRNFNSLPRFQHSTNCYCAD